jgi:hypothetical protein
MVWQHVSIDSVQGEEPAFLICQDERSLREPQLSYLLIDPIRRPTTRPRRTLARIEGIKGLWDSDNRMPKSSSGACSI